jgi:hypothetical protein
MPPESMGSAQGGEYPRPMTPARKRPEKDAPTPPQRDVKQDPAHTEGDFLRDLAKATTNKARKRLGLPSSGRG